MPPKKKMLQQKTCFLMGLVAAVASAVSGVLMLFTQGAAQLPLTIAFVMNGAMLLFLALSMKGAEHRAMRTRLLGLFLMLLVSSFGLPLLCPALEMLVLPLLCLLFYQKGDRPPLLFLCVGELGYALCRTLALTSALRAYAPLMVGLSLLLVAALRFWVLLRLHRRAGEAPA